MFAAVALLLSSALLASADRSLSLKVAAPATVTDVDNLKVLATVANTGSETLRLLRDPRSPLSQYPTETFGITNAKGARAAFSGIAVRYSPEAVAKAGRAESFLELKPGESVTVEHDLAGVYNLTSTGAGAYTFDAANLFRVVDANGALSDIYANLETAKVDVKGKLVSFKNAAIPEAKALSKRASYTGCSSTQQSQVSSAISSGQSYASSSYSHLTSNPSGSTRYTRWFGTFSTSRYNLVLNSFSRLRTYPNGWTYNCNTCSDPDTYAYVYPSRYGTVYLCGYFWAAPATGAGSRADTIIHEGTHFTQVLGTDDYTYGQSSCLSLARSNPTNAVYNADNHAFFSVNA
ncbi:peptidyl-Lys metalloendopeptidase [Ceratobasidium sp. AG-Ba]|nr:peptidyl-Lys metalloendopeptidase [Ceratobasidium sp. AG-Ba]